PRLQMAPSSSSAGKAPMYAQAGNDASENPNQSQSSTAGDEGFPESFKSTETVRRRPDIGYGMCNHLPRAGQPRSDQPRSKLRLVLSSAPFLTCTLGTLSAETTSPATLHARPPPSNNSNNSQDLLASPGRSKPQTRSRKPLIRKQSSNTPYRGEVFSTEDDPEEVHARRQQREQQIYGSRRRGMPTPNMRPMEANLNGAEEDLNLMDAMLDTNVAGPSNIGVTDESPAEDSMEDHVVDDDGNVSDAESFTLKDRQQAINQTHPFGIRLWKPALYKKDRSVQKTAEGDIHSTPGGHVSSWLLFFNLLWTLFFGWWMAAFSAVGALLCFLFAATPSGREYGAVLWGLAGYLVYPFGKVVRLEKDEAYMDEDGQEGRSISEYEQWQSGDIEHGRLFFGPDSGPRSIIGHSRASMESHASETASLLGGRSRGASSDYESEAVRHKRRLFGRGQWNIGRIVFFFFFYLLIAPSLFIVSLVCFFLVFWIPMGKVTMLLLDHMRRHPLALSFESSGPAVSTYHHPTSSVLMCTYRAVGSKYWKYTIDGTNIFLINMLAIVAFLIFDWVVLEGMLHMENFFTSSAFMFGAGLVSIIPLAYFIGQAVASISAQSSMGLGAAVNAFFSTVVEVYLYCVALNQGKAGLVEGSVVGSIFAGILFLPGLSMCFGAIKRKTQRFNAKSAGVTSTMLLFAVIGAFGPTLFYQIYGTHELNCLDCDTAAAGPELGKARDCRRCFFSQTPTLDDRFYLYAVRPYCYVAAAMLFLAYIVGLWFTLRTHAAVIWNTELEEKKNDERLAHESAMRQSLTLVQNSSLAETTGTDIRDTHLYKRILGQSLKHAGLEPQRQPSNMSNVSSSTAPASTTATASGSSLQSGAPTVPVKSRSFINIPSLSEAENNNLAREVAEMAATAAALAARNVQASASRGLSSLSAGAAASGSASAPARPHLPTRPTEIAETGGGGGGSGEASGGHDAPNWSRFKSCVILLSATVLYAAIAEILVDNVDTILQSFALDEKFVGITLFALVPNTTEFLNAISFAMNGNIALSMEIGSAYVLQVLLLQVPALVLYSALNSPKPGGDNDDFAHHTFSLIFPQWDMVTVILCVFLLSYMYGEGKSNYFKGSILLLSYLVIVIGYYFSGYTSLESLSGSSGSRFDVLDAKGEWVSYRTVGRTRAGAAFQV
ncbi:hypothetical protein TD95_004343, partial [Thielaviopsis punctulata]